MLLFSVKVKDIYFNGEGKIDTDCGLMLKKHANNGKVFCIMIKFNYICEEMDNV